MKTKGFLRWIVVCVTFVSIIAEAAEAENLEQEQMAVLVEGTVLPIVQSYCATNKATSSFDVVILKDTNLQKQLSERFKTNADCLTFESEKAIVIRDGTNVHKAKNREAYVSKFIVINQTKEKCVVEWTRTISSLSGFSKTVILTYSNGAWKVSSIKLKAVS